ncbi:MAG: hypothetical protein LC799_16200 [Actinobacteria bacterium]|nr:hypothetical protein [Actinomycetota bacterium]
MSAPGAALLAVTDTDGTAHLVTDEAMAAGRAAGCYLAVCDVVVFAASLTTPESRRCRKCRRWRAG